MVRITHHGPIVNEALGADDGGAAGAELGLAAASRPPSRACSTCSTPAPGRSWSPASSAHTSPGLEPDLGRPRRLDRLQADRPPAAAARRLPRPAQAGLERRVRVGGDGPLRGAAGADRPRERLPGHRQQPGRRRRLPPPHHQRVARRLPRPADRAAARRAATSTTSTASRRCRPTSSRSRAWRRRAGSAGYARRPSARCSAVERLRSWDGRLDPDSIAGSIYQAFLLRLAREVARAAIGDRDLGRALARPGRQRLHRPRHLALALALAPDGALGGGRRGA